jgi:hypothetical protein
MARTAGQMRCAGVCNIEHRLIRGKSQPVRLDEIGRHLIGRARCRVMPVDVASADFRFAVVALIVVEDAVARIGEPDGPIGPDGDVIWRIEPLACNSIGQNGDPAVEFGSRDTARQMLAGDEPSLIVDSVAIRVVAGRAEYRCVSAGIVVAHHPVVGDVRENQIAPGGKPGRPLQPAATRPKPLDASVTDEAAFKARVENLKTRTVNLPEHDAPPFPSNCYRYHPVVF